MSYPPDFLLQLPPSPPAITVGISIRSMAKYRLKWYRKSHANRPEDRYNSGGRKGAVEQLLADLNEVNTDDVEYKPPKRHLSGDPDLYYRVCELIISNLPAYVYLYDYLTRDDKNKVETSDRDVEEDENNE